MIIGISILALWSLSTVYPLLWTLTTSFKNNDELFANPWGLPSIIRWSNYEFAFGQINIGIINSAIITGGTILILFFISPMAAYALSKAEYLGKRPIFYTLLAGMYIAPHVALVPMYILLKNLKLIDSFLGLIIVNVASGLPYSVFISRLGFLSVPSSLEDSARVDGLSTFQTYWKIALPLALPTVLIAMILQAIFTWNDFLYPLIFLRSTELFPLTLQLFLFRGNYLVRYGPLAASIVISTIPLLILYIIFSEKIKKGIAASIGVKG